MTLIYCKTEKNENIIKGTRLERFNFPLPFHYFLHKLSRSEIISPLYIFPALNIFTVSPLNIFSPLYIFQKMYRGGSIPSARSEGVRFYEKVKGKDSSADVSDVKAPRALERRLQPNLYSPPFSLRRLTLSKEKMW